MAVRCVARDRMLGGVAAQPAAGAHCLAVMRDWPPQREDRMTMSRKGKRGRKHRFYLGRRHAVPLLKRRDETVSGVATVQTLSLRFQKLTNRKSNKKRGAALASGAQGASSPYSAAKSGS